MHPSHLLCLLLMLASVAGAFGYSRYRSLTRRIPVFQEPPHLLALRAQNEKLRKENAQLLEALNKPTPEKLLAAICQARNLPLPAIKFVGVEPARLESLRREQISREFPEGGDEKRQRTLIALGFRWEPQTPLAECLFHLHQESSAGVFDRHSRTYYFNAAVDLGRQADESAKMLLDLARVTLELTFPAPADLNEDARMVRLILLEGDAQQTHINALLSFPVPPQLEKTDPPPMYLSAPPFFRDQFYLPARLGSGALREWMERRSLTQPDALYAALPASTAELFHGETIHAPPAPNWRERLPRESLLAAGTLGEWGIQSLLKSQLEQSIAATAAAGWNGDHYAILAAPGQAEDASCWITHWGKSDDATEFRDAMAAFLLTRHGIPDAPEFRHTTGDWLVQRPERHFSIRLAPEEKSVRIISAPKAEMFHRIRSGMEK